MQSCYLITLISSRWTFNTASRFALLIMHYVSNNSLPANISNPFLYPTQVHSYNTWFSATDSFNIKYSRTNQLKHSFSIFDARILNSIPQSIRILSRHKFKVSLHQLFLRILELKDTYVGTPTLSKLWSSQLWTQFKQSRVEAWKGQDLNGVWTRDLAIPMRGRKQTPLKSWLFQASTRDCLNCVHNCEDHNLLDFKSAVQFMKYFIYHFTPTLVNKLSKMNVK